MKIRKRHLAAIAVISSLVFYCPSEGIEARAGSFVLADTFSVMAQAPDWEYDFENGWNSEFGQGGLGNQSPVAPEWRYAQMQTNESGIAVSDPVIPSNQAMRFLWQQGAGTQYDLNTQKKAHLYGEFGASHSVEEIWSFDVLFPAIGMESDQQPAIVAQWHGVPDAGEEFRRPPIAVDNKNNRLTLSWLYDERQITPAGFDDWDVSSRDLGATTKDQWINFVFHVKYDPWGSGALRVLRDGQLVVDESEIAIGFNDQLGAYLGFGIYQFTGTSDYAMRSIYFDNMRQWLVPPNAPQLTADFNSSSVVNDIDLAIWKAGFSTGTTRGQGDTDLDSDVDGLDFLILQRQYDFDSSTASIAVQAPEPSGLVLVLVLVLVIAFSFTRER